MFEGVIWASQQRGSTFGAVSLVSAFHRVRSFLAFAARRGPKCCVVRYVDDFFGCDPVGVEFGSGFVFDLLSVAVGITADGATSASDKCAMTILGIYTELQFKDRRLRVRVDEDKARRGAGTCLHIVETSICDSGLASKCAGRLSSVCTASLDQVGRAMIKPFYAQQHAPVFPASEWLMLASAWWLQYPVRAEHAFPPTKAV